MSFADIESRLASQSVSVFANATLTWGVSSSAAVVFDDKPRGLLGDAIDSGDVTVSGLTSALTGLAYGDAVAVGGDDYTVARIEAEAGLTRLTLQLA